MAEERSSFGAFERAWETAKIYGGSNTVKHFDGIVESESMKTLGQYVRAHGIESRGIDSDTKQDDKLEKYNIVKITPTRNLDEANNIMEIYLITDEHGHDIGTYEITENGPVFKLSPKIKEQNDKIMGEFKGQARDILEEKYSVKTLEDLVQKLSKDEKLSLNSKEQGKADINEEYEKKGITTSGNMEEQDPEEQEALEKIPTDMRGEAVQFAHENGLKVKEIIIVDCAKHLAEKIDNRENQIHETGGPVILIRASHGGVDSLGDDVYAFQDGRAIQSEKNDDSLENLMEQHRDEGHVTELEDDEGNSLQIELERIIEEAQAQIDIEEEKIAQIEYNMENFEPAEGQDSEEINDQMQAEIAEHEANIEQIQVNRDTKIRELARERYPLPPFDEKGMEETEEQIESNPSESHEASISEEQEDDGHEIKSRWDTANPYNHN